MNNHMEIDLLYLLYKFRMKGITFNFQSINIKQEGLVHKIYEPIIRGLRVKRFYVKISYFLGENF